MSEGPATGLAARCARARRPPPRSGVLPAQRLREAIAAGWLQADPWQIPGASVQPASVDLRLGEHAWALRCSFLPDSDSTVEQKIEELAFERIDLRDGATLERDRPYLVPLIERLALPDGDPREGQPEELDRPPGRVHARAERPQPPLRRGRRGLPRHALPRGRPAHVRDPRATGLALNQVRLMGGDGRLDDRELLELHARTPLLYLDSRPLSAERAVARRRAVPEPRRLRRARRRSSATAPRRTACRSTSAAPRRCAGATTGSRCTPSAAGGSCSSRRSSTCCSPPRACRIPPSYAAEMLAYDPTAGELRTHYAGFFDPGFGYSAERADARQPRRARGPRARRLVHGRAPPAGVQARLRADGAEPDVLYGKDIGSSYQGQLTMLSKHFLRGGARELRAPGGPPPVCSSPSAPRSPTCSTAGTSAPATRASSRC